ncbi:MAG: protease inhibitor I9 family protein, partial [Solirubrobacterales bacterium]|nr:protease inhibitor I9 family protein [Solirubrobacterales bacterium]
MEERYAELEDVRGRRQRAGSRWCSLLRGPAFGGDSARAECDSAGDRRAEQPRDEPAADAIAPGARRRAIHQNLQAPVERQLSSSAARSVHSYDVINAVSATVSPTEESQLKSNPAVSKVVPDQVIQLAPAQTSGTSATGPATAPLPGACAPPGRAQLYPQALQTIHADSANPKARTARSLGLDGSGVTVAFMADGLDINNPDFIRNGKSVFVDYKDFSGEGTGVPTGGEEAFGDASS